MTAPPSGRWDASAPNVVVEFEFDIESGLTVLPSDGRDGDCGGSGDHSALCAIMTGPDGTTTVGLKCALGATPGSYGVTIRVRGLTPAGDKQGPVLTERTVSVEVTQ